MQLAVLNHRGFYYNNMKLEVFLVPGVCSGVAGGEGREGSRQRAGHWDVPISLSGVDPSYLALAGFRGPSCMESVGSLLEGGHRVPQEVRLREEGRRAGPGGMSLSSPASGRRHIPPPWLLAAAPTPGRGPRYPFLGTAQPCHTCMPQSLARAFSARLQQEQGRAHRKPEQQAPCFHYSCFKNYKKTCLQNKGAAQ